MDTTPSRDCLPDTDPTILVPARTGLETPVFAAPEPDIIPPAPGPAEPLASSPRASAQSRLRVLGAGAALAGVAATAGIGLILVAGGGSARTTGVASGLAASAPAATTPSGGLADPGTAGQASAVTGDSGRHGHGPRDAAGFPGTGSTVEPPSGATGPGHAATGGS
jgi:hypothetical protein